MRRRVLIVGSLIGILVLAAALALGYGRNQFPFHKEKAEQSPVREIRLQKDLRVAMSDGVHLSTDIYLPANRGKYPTVVARLPYGKDDPSLLTTVARTMAERGIAFVAQDCRGRFNSEGVFAPFVFEQTDGADTVRWIKKQKWSDGRVASIGFSYLGYTAWAAAAGAREPFAALVPMFTTVSPYRMIYHRGVFHYMLALDWVMGTDGKVNNSTASFDWFRPVFSPLGKMDDLAGKDVLLYNSWIEHPTPDDYWAGVDLAGKAPALGVPTLFIGGWYDMYTQETLDDFLAVVQNGTGGAQNSRLIMGPWSHAMRSSAGETDFGPQTTFALIAKALFSWVDAHLLGKGESVLQTPRVLLFVMGENRWRAEKEWPLARTEYTKWYLHSKGKANTLQGNGSLSTQAPGKEKPDRFSFDPKRPAPTVGGNLYPPHHGGPRDQRGMEQREDVLVYTSAPLAAPLEITGPIEVTLFAASTAKDTDFTAKLVAVQKDGRAINLQDGIVRARYRNGLHRPEWLTKGEIVPYRIDLASTSYLFQSGEQIRVEISSSNFPRFDVNHNTGNDPATDEQYAIAGQTVFHDFARPSHITLPVIPRKEQADHGN